MNVTSALGWIVGSGSSPSGAIDVVSVRQADGKFTCSPFHVKFPSRAVFKTKGNRTVNMQVNGEPVKASMRLGSAGEAYFIIKNQDASAATSTKGGEKSGERESVGTAVVQPIETLQPTG